jgi:hypothetical protein
MDARPFLSVKFGGGGVGSNCRYIDDITTKSADGEPNQLHNIHNI